jgi:hypothetical protein
LKPMVIDKPPKDAFSKTGWPGALPVPGARRLQGSPPKAAPSAQDIMERRAMQPSVLKEKGSTDRL